MSDANNQRDYKIYEDFFYTLLKVQEDKRGIYDHSGSIPSFLLVTDAKQHEVKAAKEQDLPKNQVNRLLSEQVLAGGIMSFRVYRP